MNFRENILLLYNACSIFIMLIDFLCDFKTLEKPFPL